MKEFVTYPDAVHAADLGTHGRREDAIEAERSAATLVQLARQCTHEARETEVRVAA